MTSFGPQRVSPAVSGSAPPLTPPPPSEAADSVMQRQDGPTERLRRAADELERRAAAATPGPWYPEHAGVGGSVHALFVECDGEDCGHDRYNHADGTCAIGSFNTPPDNEWAILANPALAKPLAALLRAEASHVGLLAALDEEAPGTVRVRLSTAAEVLAVADVILGSAR